MIQIPISTNAQAILADVNAFPARMAKAIATALNDQNQLTIGHANLNYMTGPRPGKLGRVSSLLASSLNAPPAKIQGNVIVSSIGTNVKYAGVHEHGFEGDVTVRAHARRNRRAGAAKKSFDMKTGRISKAKGGAGATIQVRSFSRHMKMPARPFLAPAINDRKAAYSDAISAAILSSWNGGQP